MCLSDKSGVVAYRYGMLSRVASGMAVIVGGMGGMVALSFGSNWQLGLNPSQISRIKFYHFVTMTG